MKKPFHVHYYFILFILFCFYSCKKTDQINPADQLSKSQLDLEKSQIEDNESSQFTGSYDETSETPTIIDYQLPNPYTIPNMRQAYRNATGQNITPVVTNLYVRFKPSDMGQLETLAAAATSMDFELSDEPMDYHVVQEGDYYQDPSIPEEEITWQYAVVPPGFQPPSGIQYEQLAAIHIPDNISVEAEAERLVGLNADGDDYGGAAIHDAEPSVTACLEGYHWDHESRQCVPNNCPEGFHWDNFRQQCVSNTPPPPPPAIIPRGAITVWDTQFEQNLPVRNARVVVRRWFKVERTYTNNGNFQVTKNFRNKVEVLVKFLNPNASIRGVRGVRVWQAFFPIKRKIGVFSNNNIANANFNFRQTPDINSIGNRFWAGATTHNAVQEHHEYANQFGFSAAPTNLNIFLTNSGLAEGLASTPLFHTRFLMDLPMSFINTFLINIPVPGIIPSLLALYARTNVDIAVDYRAAINRFRSDWLKSIIYHEMSHASHFSQVGTGWYTDFVNAELAEIVANPNGDFNSYGRGNTANSPIIAVGEAWGFHMERFLADQRYGVLNSSEVFDQGNGYNNNDIPGLSSHLVALENFDPNLPTDPFNWIPSGLMRDLMDDTPFETIVNDQVLGFTIPQLFNALQADITSPQQYRDRLLQQNGNNPQVPLLFAEYRFN